MAGDEPQGRSPGAHGVQSADTGLDVLSTFIGAEPMPMLKTLADRAGMPPAKMHRYLVSLCRMGFVEQDEQSRRYRLGPAALRLAFAAMAAVDSIRVARPLLPAYCKQIGHTVLLAVWNSTRPTIAIRESPPNLLAIMATEGATVPILRSSIGNVFGAYLPRERTAGLIAQDMDDPQPGVPSTPAEVELLFAEVRRRGVARTTGQLSKGWNSFAVPIFDAAGDLAAILCTLGPADDFDASWDSPLATSLRGFASDVSRRLGHIER